MSEIYLYILKLNPKNITQGNEKVGRMWHNVGFLTMIQTDFFSENSLFGLFISDYVQNFENSMSEMKEFL